MMNVTLFLLELHTPWTGHQFIPEQHKGKQPSTHNVTCLNWTVGGDQSKQGNPQMQTPCRKAQSGIKLATRQKC